MSDFFVDVLAKFVLPRYRSLVEAVHAKWFHCHSGIGVVGDECRIGRRVRVIGNPAGIRIGRRVIIEDNVSLVCAGSNAELVIGDGCHLYQGAVLDTGRDGSIRLGRSNSVNPYTVLYGHGGLTTGSFVRIAAHTVIIPANHIFEATDKPIAKQGLTKLGIVIEDDVWIGSGVRVLDGVRIGTGAVVAAGSVVNRSVPSMAVVGGVPARVLKVREVASAKNGESS